MRTFWILVAVMSLNIAANANHEKAAIVIKSGGQVPIVVHMDGNRNQQTPAPVVRFNNIRPGQHHVQIYILLGGYGHYNHGHPQRQLVYSGPVHALPGYKMVFNLHRDHLDLVSQRPLNGYGQGGYCAPVEGYGCGYEYGGGYNGYGFDAGCSPPGVWGPSQGVYGQYNVDPNGWSDSGSPYYRVMSARDFQHMLQRSRSHFFESDKVDFYLKELKDEYVSNSQVRQLADELFFETEKYKLLTNLLERSAEPDQYESLSDEFTFSSTKRDFEKYIQTHRSLATHK